MATKEDQVLRAAKEVVVKFIEIGRVSPANFPEAFQMIYEAINAQMRGPRAETSVVKEKES
jgi:hypothetical protein